MRSFINRARRRGVHLGLGVALLTAVCAYPDSNSLLGSHDSVTAAQSTVFATSLLDYGKRKWVSEMQTELVAAKTPIAAATMPPAIMNAPAPLLIRRVPSVCPGVCYGISLAHMKRIIKLAVLKM